MKCIALKPKKCQHKIPSVVANMYKELVHNRFILVHTRISTYKISTVNLRPSKAFQCLREEPD